jgi:hypothetical protein
LTPLCYTRFQEHGLGGGAQTFSTPPPPNFWHKFKIEKDENTSNTIKTTDVTGWCMPGDNQLKAINKVPLSNSTVSRRIDIMSCNIEYELIKQIKCILSFAMQVDESTANASFCFACNFETHV